MYTVGGNVNWQFAMKLELKIELSWSRRSWVYIWIYLNKIKNRQDLNRHFSKRRHADG